MTPNTKKKTSPTVTMAAATMVILIVKIKILTESKKRAKRGKGTMDREEVVTMEK